MSSLRSVLRNSSSAALVMCALGGCMSMPSVNLWPFGGEPKTAERSRIPSNATEYRCDGGKSFYLRTLEGGSAVWLIYPDRQVRLEKQTIGASTHYTNGVATLRLETGTASLTDGTTISYNNCKVPTAETKPSK